MSTYHLQSDGDRSVIHTEFVTHKALIDCKMDDGTVERVLAEVPFESRGEVEAASWLDAKKKFGFELSALQQRLLAEQRQ